MNVARRCANRSIQHGLKPSLHLQQTRRVSKVVWDSFGFLKDGTDIKKRSSVAQLMPKYWRFVWGACLMGPAHFLFWLHGGFDYILRRRAIAPFQPDPTAEYPMRPPAGVQNPLFAPARKWEKVREEKRRKLEENKFDRPFYFKEIMQRPPRHKYRQGGR